MNASLNRWNMNYILRQKYLARSSDSALEGVVDFLSEVLRHHIRLSIGFDVEDLVPEVLLDGDDLGLPGLVLLPNDLLRIFDQLNEPVVRGLIGWWGVKDVVLLAGLWVHPNVSLVTDTSLLVTIKDKDDAWLDLQGF